MVDCNEKCHDGFEYRDQDLKLGFELNMVILVVLIPHDRNRDQQLGFEKGYNVHPCVPGKIIGTLTSSILKFVHIAISPIIFYKLYFGHSRTP